MDAKVKAFAREIARCTSAGEGGAACLIRGSAAYDDIPKEGLASAAVRRIGCEAPRLTCKAVAVSLSLALVTSCSPLPAYAVSPEGGGGLIASSATLQTSALTAAEEGHSSLYTAYLPVLLRVANGLGEFEDSYRSSDASQWAPEYSLFDLGGEGVPELLVRTSAFGGAGLVRVFTVKSGEVLQIGSYWEWFGGSAGNGDGELYSAGWHEGSSYVNSITLDSGNVVSTFLKSGKATSSNPNGEVQMVDEFMATHRATWLESSKATDFALLEREARYALSRGMLSVGPAGSYTGSPVVPTVTVKFGDTTLRQGVDYDVAYQDNVNAGIATVVATGRGDYQGSLTARFSIDRADLSKAVTSLASAGSYDGRPKTPEGTVRLGATVLKAGTDYSVSYQNNVNAGTGTAVITGKGNYKGSKTVTFAIGKPSVSRASLSVVSAGAYTGLAKTPAVHVSVDGRTLVQDLDYRLTYKNNKNAGTATVIVEGRGNYQGSTATTFPIERADIAKVSASVALAGSFTGVAKMPSTTVKMLGSTLHAGTDYAVSYKNNVKAGTATALITGMGNYRGVKSVSFAIGKADLSQTSLKVASGGVYTGRAKTPAVTVSVGGKRLVKGSDYKLRYRNNTGAGKASVTVEGIGNYKGSKSATFTIAKASNPLSLKVANQTVKVKSVAKKPRTFTAITFSKKPQGKVVFKNSSSATVSKWVSVNKSTGAITLKKGAKKGTYLVKVGVVAKGNANYNGLTKSVTVRLKVK